MNQPKNAVVGISRVPQASSAAGRHGGRRGILTLAGTNAPSAIQAPYSLS
jgi:hypothetical protein